VASSSVYVWSPGTVLCRHTLSQHQISSKSFELLAAIALAQAKQNDSIKQAFALGSATGA
jgi:hypothetical protein